MPDRPPIRILLLDDERIWVDILAQILRQHGYETRGTYRHAQAIAAAHEFQPDVFITGVFNEPYITGCDTAAEVLGFLPNCRVLICSGAAEAYEHIERLRVQGYRFEAFAKPIHPGDLLEMLARPPRIFEIAGRQ